MARTSAMAPICVSRPICSYLAVAGMYSTPGFHYRVLDLTLYRPEAVNVSNMAALIDSEGKPHFKYIVEGANLFLTQQARLHLEKRKVILFKDSSANKGMFV
jgi:hypothetical protein